MIAVVGVPIAEIYMELAEKKKQKQNDVAPPKTRNFRSSFTKKRYFGQDPAT